MNFHRIDRQIQNAVKIKAAEAEIETGEALLEPQRILCNCFHKNDMNVMFQICVTAQKLPVLLD